MKGMSFIVFMTFMLVPQAQEWPRFRGPTGEGQSTERGLPLEWSESKNVAWKVPVTGLAWSSPVVANNRVWITTAIEDRGNVSLRLVSFDGATGTPLLSTVVHVRPEPGAGSSTGRPDSSTNSSRSGSQ